MKTTTWGMAVIVMLAVLISGVTAQAEYIISNETVTSSGNYYVEGSSTGDYALLVITNNGVLKAADIWFIKTFRGGNNNTAIVDGSGSRANIGDEIRVGYGTNNLLRVQNGAQVTAYEYRNYAGGDQSNRLVVTSGSSMIVTNFMQSGSGSGSYNEILFDGGSTGQVLGEVRAGFGSGNHHNSITVTDTDTTFDGDEVKVGAEGGSYNSLTVSSNARFNAVGNGSSHLVGFDAGDHNRVTVNHDGMFAIQGPENLYIGGSTSEDNGFYVRSGGVLTNSGSGEFRVGHATDHNELIVEGSGSEAYLYDVTVGNLDGANHNLVAISNQAYLSVGNDLIVGVESGSDSNRLVVDNARLDVGRFLYVGDDSSYNEAVVSNGASVNVGANTRFGLPAGSSEGNSLLITGAGTTYSNASGALEIGYFDSDDNSVRVEDGAHLYTRRVGSNIGSIRIGRDADASGNSLTVTGAGTTWTNIAGHVWVGENGSDGTLAIEDQAQAYLDSHLYVNRYSSSQDNELIVDNADLTVVSNVYVGTAGSGARMSLTSGAAMDVDGTLDVGYNSAATGVVNASTLTVEGDMMVGKDAGGALLLTNGAVLNSKGQFTLGTTASGTHSMIVDGSTWNALENATGSADKVYFGYEDDTTLIRNGSVVSNVGNTGWFYIGGAGGNTVILDDSTMHAGNFYQGITPANNHLVVTNGATFNTLSFTLGYNAGSTNHDFLITGNGTTADIGATLRIGNNGSHNRGLIDRQAVVTARDLTLGASDGDNNSLVVDGTGTEVSLSQDSYVGQGAGAVDNWMLVTNGALVQSQGLTVGSDATAVSNRLILAGADTAWTNIGSIYVSAGGGEGNRIEVNDATLYSDDVQVGTNGTLTLSGSARVESTVLVAQEGLLAGSGEIVGSVTNAGTIAPGASPGTIAIDGSLTLTADSEVVMEIAGTNAGEFDQITVTDQADFDGTLTLNLLAGYTAQDGDSFQLFDADSYAGQFSTRNLEDPGTGLSWDTDDLDSTGTLTVIPEPAALMLLLPALLAFRSLRRREQLR